MRFLSVCSGMEAASVAWEPLGWKAVGFSEIEPFPCAILKHRFPNTPNYGSLTEYQSWPLGPDSIDLLVGGTPCQSFSVAGLRKGLADPRGNLALTFLGLADKLRPRWIVWENVPGVLSSGGGRDFGSFLGALEQLGYGWAYRVLDAQYFGVPQRRRRVFVVASLGGRDVAASVLLEPQSLCWHPAKGRKKGQATAPDAGSGVEAGGRKWPADTACTLNASFGEKQGLEDQHALGGGSLFVPAPICMSSGQANAAIAEDKAHTLNATHETQTVALPVVDRAASHWDGGPHPTLNQSAKASGGVGSSNQELFSQGGAYLVPGAPIPFRKSKRACSTTDNEPHIVQASELRLRGEIKPQDTCPTLLANTKSGDNDPLAVHAITFQPGNLRREAGADPSTTTTTTLKASAGDQMPHVAVAFDGYNQTISNTSQTIRADKSDCDHVGMILTPMAVRRLTPTECERLQGFPDNWSRIPWKGKPEDQCPDGPRYKACGNSMAVPVMRWIGEQIARVELSHNPTNQTNA